MLKIFLKKWIFLAIIIIFNLFIALRTAIGFFYFFFWFLLSIVIIGLLWVAVEYLGIRFGLERKTGSKIQEDDILEIETVIKNKSFFPIFNFILQDYLSCATPQERQKLISLEYVGPRSVLDIRYRCQCPLRGRYVIGPFSLYLFDPWGLFFLKKTYFINSELYVYPQTFNIKKFPPLIKGNVPWFGIESSRVSGDEHEFYGIREYKQGDPIKRIHWLSTARKNRLIVKQFQLQSFFRATVIFNLEKDKNFGEGKESVVEYIIKIAASAAKYLIEKDVSLEIIAHTGEMVHIPFNKGPEHLEDIFRFLAVAQAESRVNLSEIFQEFCKYIPGDSSLIVIMLDTDWDCLPAMLSLEKKNVSLVPLILDSSSFLSPPAGQGTIRDTGIALPQLADFSPILFFQGDNLEEKFLKY